MGNEVEELLATQTRLERERDQFQAMFEVTRTLAKPFELRELFVQVSTALRKFVRQDYTGLAIFEDHSNHLRLYAMDFPEGKGLIREDLVMPRAGSLCGAALNSGKPILMTSLLEDGMAFEVSRLLHVWALPFGKGRFREGWQLSGIYTIQTGTPVDVGLAFDNSNTGNSGSLDRPNCVGNPNANAPHTVLDWFNTAAFAAPVQSTFGNCGKNVITGPAVQNLDLLLSKVFAPIERLRIQFRVEVFNVANHPSFDPPNAVYGNPLFGQIASAGDARETQLALKFLF
jgi:hypothetical protein